jgi:hypothetical protein
VSTVEGGYVTRGRAKHLFDRLEALEREVDERLSAIEKRLDDLAAFEFELLRRRVAADIEFLQTYRGRRSG